MRERGAGAYNHSDEHGDGDGRRGQNVGGGGINRAGPRGGRGRGRGRRRGRGRCGTDGGRRSSSSSSSHAPKTNPNPKPSQPRLEAMHPPAGRRRRGQSTGRRGREERHQHRPGGRGRSLGRAAANDTGGGGGGGDDDENDEVVAQLSRQREKARAAVAATAAQAEAEEGSSRSASNPIAASAAAVGAAPATVGACADGGTRRREMIRTPQATTMTTTTTTKAGPAPNLGRYRYDPARGAYFPAAEDDNGGRKRRKRKGSAEKRSCTCSDDARWRAAADVGVGSPPPPNPRSCHRLLQNQREAILIARGRRPIDVGNTCQLLLACSVCPTAGRRGDIFRSVRDRLVLTGATVVPSSTPCRPPVIDSQSPPRTSRAVGDDLGGDGDGGYHPDPDDSHGDDDGDGDRVSRGNGAAVETGIGRGDDSSRRWRRQRPRPPTSDGSRRMWWASMFRPVVDAAAERRRISSGSYHHDHDNSAAVPLDCLCKYRLHPSSPTFDVSVPTHSAATTGGGDYTSSTSFPSFVTMLDRGGLYYSPPRRASRRSSARGDGTSLRPFHLSYSRDGEGYSRGGERATVEDLVVVPDGDDDPEFGVDGGDLGGEGVLDGVGRADGTSYRAVRFAPLRPPASRSFGGQSGEGNEQVFGVVSSPSTADGNTTCTFIMCGTGTLDRGRPRQRPGWRGRRSAGYRLLSVDLPEGSEANDFAFSASHQNSLSWNHANPSRVAFALSAPSSWKSSNPNQLYELDVSTGRFMTMTSPRRLHALLPRLDAFCVKYCPKLGGGDDCTLLYGHRNGSVSVVDRRSGMVVSSISASMWCAREYDSFGSVASLRVVSDNIDGGGRGDPNLVLAKGSFGSCFLFDVRRLGGGACSTAGGSRRSPPPCLLHHLTVPHHRTAVANDATKSGRCSGLASDPSGSVAISPFVSTENVAHLGLWSLVTGNFVGSVPLVRGSCYHLNNVRHPTRAVTYDHCDPLPAPPAFCELSGTISEAWEMHTGEPLATRKASVSPSVEVAGVHRLETRAKWWGLWIKCGSMPLQSSPASTRIPGIHHVIFPGSFDP